MNKVVSTPSHQALYKDDANVQYVFSLFKQYFIIIQHFVY